MLREDTAISVKRETWKRLAILKVELGFKNYDELVNYLLRRAGYGDGDQ
jgi:hypothetical protein